MGEAAMGAYSEVYLQEIVETQGDFFENIRDYVPGIDVRNFIEVYMSGKTRSYIDQAKAYVCTMNAEQLWEYFRRGEFFQPKEGNGIGGFIPNWIGQFYFRSRRLQNRSCRQIRSVRSRGWGEACAAMRSIFGLDAAGSSNGEGRIFWDTH